MKFETGDSAFIELKLNKLYTTHRWILATDRRVEQDVIAIGKDFQEYENGQIIEKELAICLVRPELKGYEKSNFKLKAEHKQRIIKDLFESNEVAEL